MKTYCFREVSVTCSQRISISNSFLLLIAQKQSSDYIIMTINFFFAASLERICNHMLFEEHVPKDTLFRLFRWKLHSLFIV